MCHPLCRRPLPLLNDRSESFSCHSVYDSVITCYMNRSTGDIFLSAQHQQYPMAAQSSSGLPVIPEMGSSYHTLPSGDHRLTPTSSSPYMPSLGLPPSVPRGPAYRSDDAHSIGHWHSPSNTSHVHPSQTYVSISISHADDRLNLLSTVPCPIRTTLDGAH